MREFKILLDQPAREPALDFEKYANSIARIAQTSDAQFAIGIFGGWGSGKTTLMRAMERRLKGNKGVITVRFSAWRYEKEEHLLIPLLDTLREALVEWSARESSLRKVGLATASTIGKVVHSLLAGVSMKIGLPAALELSFDANKSLAQADRYDKEEEDARVPRSFYHASFRALNTALTAFVERAGIDRIVVFVDDLDRCLPEGALNVLESVKLFLDLKGFVFVIGLDREIVEAAVNVKYVKICESTDLHDKAISGTLGSDYVKKIFQVPFSLFPVAVTEINGFLEAVCKEANLSEAQLQDLRTVVRPHLRFLVTESGLNPREIKRYINSYTLLRKIKPSLIPNVILAMQTIDFRSDWASVKEGLYAYRQHFINALRNQVVNEERRALEELHPGSRAISSDFFEYVREDRPAHRLLGVENIDEYIYAGEATKSSRISHGVADLVRQVTCLRRYHQVLADLHSASGERQNAAEHLASGISDIKSALEQSQRILDPFSQSVCRNMDDLSVLLRNPSPEPKERENWVRRIDELISRSVADIMRGGRESY